MWPFKKNKSNNKEIIKFSQVDVTEAFGDNAKLKLEDWVTTTPLNSQFDMNKEDLLAKGLPEKDATLERVYEMAKTLSDLREKINIPNDGVYCPICHIANTQLNKLHTPCPKCGRALLKFGWD